MPWNQVTKMEIRKQFMEKVTEEGLSMAAACRQFNVSRPTGYKWLERFEAQGDAGLEDQSRAPKRIPHRTAESIEAHVVRLRSRHPTWGPKKLRAVLLRRFPEVDWPAASTMGDILDRKGLIPKLERSARTPPHTRPLAHALLPNDVWSIDFKGQFLLGNGRLVYPLTVTDNASRMLLGCFGLETTTTELVQPLVHQLFREFGRPLAIRSDNGAPFASTGVLGLSKLSADWLANGVAHERIEVGHPEQNGRHERMHLTLKRETARPGAADFLRQQERFDVFREEYNHVRPHEALGQTPPAEHYRRSERLFPDGVAPLDYSAFDLVMRVRKTGELRIRKSSIYVSMALAEQPVGLLEIDEDVWLVNFAGHDLGIFEPGDARIEPISRGRVASADDFESDDLEVDAG